MRLPNAKTLLCWPSRMQIYGLVENHTFLEQFVSRGYQDIFSNLGVPGQFSQPCMASSGSVKTRVPLWKARRFVVPSS